MMLHYRRPFLMTGSRIALLLLAASLTWTATAVPESPARPRVLMVTYSGAYQHDVVRREAPDGLSLAERTVVDLGRRSGAVDVSPLYSRDDLQRLTVDSFAGVRAVLFFTTGSPPFRPEDRKSTRLNSSHSQISY